MTSPAGTTVSRVGARAASGAAWNLSLGLLVRGVALLGTLAIARYVAPTDYGNVTAAAICVATATHILTFGAGAYAIARRSDPRETFELGSLHVLAVGAACLAVTVFAGPLGIAVGAPGMGRYLPWLAMATFIGQSSHIAGATLVRDLHFKVVALSRALSELSFTAVAIALAPFFGAAAIVAGNLARAFVLSGLLVTRSNRRAWWAPAPIRFNTIRSLLRFGGPIAGTNVATDLASQWDNLLMSRLFGPAVLGQYNLAYNLAATPSTSIAENIGDVLEPSFALVDPARRRQEAARAAGLMSLVLAPMALGIAAVSAQLVPLVFNPRWQPMVPMLVVLSALSLARPATWIVDAILRLRLRTELLLALELLKAVAVLGGIAMLGPAGPVFACAAVPIAFALHGVAAVFVAWRVERIPAIQLFGAVARPTVAAALMALLVAGVPLVSRALGLPTGWFEVVLQVVIGALSYGALSWLIARSTLEEFVALARQALTQ